MAPLVSTAAIGLIPSVSIFIIAYMWIENRECWVLSVPVAIIMTLLVYFVFDHTFFSAICIAAAVILWI